MSISRWFISVLAAVAFCFSLFGPIRSLATDNPLWVHVASGATGSESLLVDGGAPPFADITLNVSDNVSSDIPTLSIKTVEVRADSQGRFSASLSIAPVYSRGSMVTVTASIGNGTATATESTYITAPNAGTTVPDWDGTQ